MIHVFLSCEYHFTSQILIYHYNSCYITLEVHGFVFTWSEKKLLLKNCSAESTAFKGLSQMRIQDPVKHLKGAFCRN